MIPSRAAEASPPERLSTLRIAVGTLGDAIAQSHVDLIQNGFEAIAESDVEALLAVMHPEIEWRPPTQGTLAEVFEGREGVRQLFDQLFEAWERIGNEPVKLVEGDDQAVIVTNIQLRARLSGLEINEQWAYAVEFRDGLFWRVQMYTDPEQALRENGSAVLASAPDWPS